MKSQEELQAVLDRIKSRFRDSNAVEIDEYEMLSALHETFQDKSRAYVKEVVQNFNAGDVLALAKLHAGSLHPPTPVSHSERVRSILKESVAELRAMSPEQFNDEISKTQTASVEQIKAEHKVRPEDLPWGGGIHHGGDELHPQFEKKAVREEDVDNQV